MNKRTAWLREHRSELAISLMGALLYLVLALLFFGAMAVGNWHIRGLSRTLATMMLTYFAMSVAMHAVYGGYAVGRKKDKPIISSMSLAALATDAVTYVQLQIMNVNPSKNDYLAIFGPDFLPLILCMALQTAAIIAWVHAGNRLYFRLNPPRSCLLVFRDADDEIALRRKIGRYALQWQVTQALPWDDPRLDDAVEHAGVVFVGHVPAETKARLLRRCYDLRRDVLCSAQLEDIMLGNAAQVVVDDAAFLQMCSAGPTLGQRCIKRAMDAAVSALGLAVLSPLMLAVALAIWLEDRGSPLFWQERLTLDGRAFRICKFRTMRVEESHAAHMVSAAQEDPRLTRVGRVLRRWRLDELPQLWNILRGDMSLVGPRPEMLDNLRRYKEQLPAFRYRERMKAGLTGYAQIEGRYNTSPEDKLMLDLMYIESFSVWQDVKLLFRTLTVFFKADSTAGFAADASAAPPTDDASPGA